MIFVYKYLRRRKKIVLVIFTVTMYLQLTIFYQSNLNFGLAVESINKPLIDYDKHLPDINIVQRHVILNSILAGKWLEPKSVDFWDAVISDVNTTSSDIMNMVDGLSN